VVSGEIIFIRLGSLFRIVACARLGVSPPVDSARRKNGARYSGE
jgi:hypothetical protein